MVSKKEPMSLLIEQYANVAASSIQASAPLYGSGRVSGPVFVPVPRYDSAQTVTILPGDYYVVATYNGTTEIELPAAADNVGRVLVLRSNSGETLNSTASNVARPGAGSVHSSVSDELHYDEYQAWVEIVSDGSYWLITRGNYQAYD